MGVREVGAGSLFAQIYAFRGVLADLSQGVAEDGSTEVTADLSEVRAELDRITGGMPQPGTITTDDILYYQGRLQRGVLVPMQERQARVDPESRHTATLALHALLNSGVALQAPLATGLREAAPLAAAVLATGDSEFAVGAPREAHSVAASAHIAAPYAAPITEPHFLRSTSKIIQLVRCWILFEIAQRGPGEMVALHARIEAGIGCEPSQVGGGFDNCVEQLISEGLVSATADVPAIYDLTEKGQTMVASARPGLLHFLGLSEGYHAEDLGPEGAKSHIASDNQSASLIEPEPKKSFVGNGVIAAARFFILVDGYWHHHWTDKPRGIDSSGDGTREARRRRLRADLGITLGEDLLTEHVRQLKAEGYATTEMGSLSLTQNGRYLAARGIAQWAKFLGIELPRATNVALTPGSDAGRNVGAGRDQPLQGTTVEQPRRGIGRSTPVAGPRAGSPRAYSSAPPNDLLMWQGGEFSLRTLLITTELALRGEAPSKILAERLRATFPDIMQDQTVYLELQSLVGRKDLLSETKRRVPEASRPSAHFGILPAAQGRSQRTIAAWNRFLGIGEEPSAAAHRKRFSEGFEKWLSHKSVGRDVVILLDLLVRGPLSAQELSAHIQEYFNAENVPGLSEATFVAMKRDGWVEDSESPEGTKYSLTAQGRNIAEDLRTTLIGFFSSPSPTP